MYPAPTYVKQPKHMQKCSWMSVYLLVQDMTKHNQTEVCPDWSEKPLLNPSLHLQALTYPS